MNRKRLIDEFVNIVKLDSPSLSERLVADYVKAQGKELGMEVYEDKAGDVYGGNCGNVYLTLKGDAHIEPLLFLAHMDTVTPCINKKVVIDGDIIRSDGTTILGGDDACGMVSILEAVRMVIEEKISHGDIEVIFTIGEELSLCGAKELEYSRIRSKLAFVMDANGEMGTAFIDAPAQNGQVIKIYGQAAHAGIEPEKGVNAITIAAKAISNMKLGRIDHETTANIGEISGGLATNIVCPEVVLHCEARSRDFAKLEQQTKHMIECFESAAAQMGGKIEAQVELQYAQYHIDEQDRIIKLFEKGAQRAGVPMTLGATGGGSDTNVLNYKGIKAIDIACSMRNVHRVDEYVDVNELEQAVLLVLGIIEGVGECNA